MKPLKAAAVVAGSLVVAGAAAPAFAADPMPTSLNGALEALSSQQELDVQPLHTNAIDTEQQGTLANTLQSTANNLNDRSGTPGKLLGGLPLPK